MTVRGSDSTSLSLASTLIGSDGPESSSTVMKGNSGLPSSMATGGSLTGFTVIVTVAGSDSTTPSLAV
jgi:hypothetical protein